MYIYIYIYTYYVYQGVLRPFRRSHAGQIPEDAFLGHIVCLYIVIIACIGLFVHVVYCVIVCLCWLVCFYALLQDPGDVLPRDLHGRAVRQLDLPPMYHT